MLDVQEALKRIEDHQQWLSYFVWLS
jgi:hypothetical protein